MKKTAALIGTIGLILIILTILFKLHHWEGAGLLLGYGTLFNCVIVLPIIFIYLLRSDLKSRNLYVFGTISAFILYAGIFFKINHWPLSQYMQATGTLLFVIFLILNTVKLMNSPKD
jgi:hypothetical protein